MTFYRLVPGYAGSDDPYWPTYVKRACAALSAFAPVAIQLEFPSERLRSLRDIQRDRRIGDDQLTVRGPEAC